MNRIHRFVLLFILVLFCALPSIAQSRKITESEFWNPLYKARDSIAKLTRREVRRVDSSVKGRLTFIHQWEREYVIPDSTRSLHIERTGDKTSRTEEIKIGSTWFCRNDKGAWVKRPCGGGTLGSGPNPGSSKYTVESAAKNGHRITIYTRYITYPGDKNLRYSEFRYSLDEKGRILAETDTAGRTVPKSVEYRMRALYEYDPKGLRIHAPIK